MAKKQAPLSFNPWWNIVAVVAVIAVNIQASLGWIGGVTTAEVSDSFPIYFVPAGYAFSIWGLIYVGLAAYAIYSVQPNQRKNARLRHVDYFFLMAAVSNMLWIFLWHSARPALSILAMAALLIALVNMYGVCGRVKAKTKAEWWAVDAPVSSYLGWITVATLANLSAVLHALGYPQPPAAAFLFMVLAAFIGQAVLVRRRDYIFAGVVVWALVGIGVKFMDVPLLQYGSWGLSMLIVLTAMAMLTGWIHPTTRKTLEGDR